MLVSLKNLVIIDLNRADTGVNHKPTALIITIKYLNK